MRVYSQLNWSSCHMSCMNVACNWSTCYSLRFRVSIQSHHVGLVCLLFFLFWYISRALQFSIAIISPSWLMRSHWICWLGKGYHRNLGKKVWLSLPDPAKKKVHLPRELLQWFEQRTHVSMNSQLLQIFIYLPQNSLVTERKIKKRESLFSFLELSLLSIKLTTEEKISSSSSSSINLSQSK